MANKIKGLTVEIGGDTTKLGKALESVEKKSRDLQTELRGVNTLLKHDPSNTVLLTQKQEILTEAIEETSKKLKTLKDAQEQVQEQFDKNEITKEQFRDFQREIEATEQKLKGLNEEMDKFGSVGAQKIAAAGEQVKDVGGKVEAVGKKFTAMSTIATAGLVATTTKAIDFETAWTGVTKTVDGTPEQLEAIKQGLLDLSGTTASSAEDIAAVAEAAGQLGIKTESILDFTETMVMLGDTTNLSAEEAASALAKFANITGMGAENYGKLGSVIVDLGNNFATTEADIVAMATRLASTGEITGLSEAQIMALATALSSAGIEAEAGGSAMAKLLKMLYSTDASFETAAQAIDATGYSLRDLQLLQSNGGSAFKDLADSMGLTKKELGEYLETVLQMNNYASTAGVSVDEFRQAYAEDAVGALSMFITGLNDTERNGKGAVEILNEMGITEVRLSNAVLAMASSGDLMTSAIDTATTAWGENTALTEEAEKRYSTTASKIEQLKNKLTELCVSFGTILLPVVQSVVESLKSLVDWFTNLSPATQTVMLVIAALVAALAPTLIVIGNIITAVGQIMTFAPQLVTMLGKVKTAISGLFSLIAAHPIIAIVTAIIAVVVLLYTKCEWFRDGVHAVLEKVQEGFDKFVDFLGRLPERAVAFLSTLVDNASTWSTNMATKAKEAGSQFSDNVSNFFEQLPSKAETFFEKTVSKVTTWGSNLFTKGKAAASKLVTAVSDEIKNLPSKLQRCGEDLVQGLWNGITGMGSWLKDKLSIFASGILDGFKDAFQINSPSRETAWQGEMLTEGLAEGVEANATRPIRAMKRVADGVLDAVSTEMANRALWQTKTPTAQTVNSVGTTADNTALLAKLDGIYERLGRLQVVLDSGTLVGETIDKIDAALGNRQLLSARGV